MQDKSKLLLSVLGVSVAILLIMIMDGIFAGTEEQLTVYINKTPVQVFVMQDGVENMHMAMTFFPSDYKEAAEKIKGVKKAVAVTYMGSDVKVKHVDIPVYLIGWEQKENIGGPWSMVKGKKKVNKGEVIIDEVIARKHGLKLGNILTILGKKLEIVGTTEGTFSMVSSIFFINPDDFAQKVPPNTISFLLVQTEKSADVTQVTERINDKLKLAHALTKGEFAASERNIARKMGVEVIAIMTFISFLAAIGVVAISIYSLTMEKIRDFGVLKAIGANKSRLYSLVISQALISTLLAVLVGTVLSFGLAQLLQVLASEVLIIIKAATFFKALIIAVVVGIIAAYLPVRQIAGIDPAIVFKS